MSISPSQFEIHPSSGVPIYRQLMEQVRAMVAGGRLEGGALLPSVRDMASTHGVNPMTISKAYARLEAEGLLERLRGKGMQVRQEQALETPRERVQQLRDPLEGVITIGRQLGLTDKQIIQLVQQLLEENPLQ